MVNLKTPPRADAARKEGEGRNPKEAKEAKDLRERK